MPDPLITTQDELEALVEESRVGELVGVDTEFRRTDTYFARLCLIQVATPERVACIDPLADLSFEPLCELLVGASPVKVMHAARQDCEVLWQRFGLLPWPLFDTQIAATFCGHGDQVSYALLVERVCGRQLDKGATRTDWCRRPLTEQQVRYAEDDVRFLPELHGMLTSALDGQGRAGWAREEFERLRDPALYEVHPDEAWQRIGAASRLPARGQWVARALAAWRETRARERNRPRGWILADADLVELARQAGAASVTWPDAIQGRHRGELATLLRSAHAEAGAREPLWPPRSPRDDEIDAVTDAMLARVRSAAGAADLPAPFIASRRDVRRWAEGDRDTPLVSGWRAELLDAPVAVDESIDGTRR